MRHFYTFLSLLFVFHGYAQINKKTIFSAMIISVDSVPVPNVAIINSHTLKTVKTDSRGYFQTETEGNDSLLIHHISYKKRFINEKDNMKCIVIEPEIHELKQVDVRNDYSGTLQTMMKDIKEIARQKKLTKEEMKSSSQKSTDQFGSHNKGFSPFFGPTTTLPIGKIAGLITSRNEKRDRKKLTSHYHLVKKKPVKRKE